MSLAATAFIALAVSSSVGSVGVSVGMGEAEVEISSAGVRSDAWNTVFEVGVVSVTSCRFRGFLFDLDLVTNLQIT
jgi:hypothetical protein